MPPAIVPHTPHSPYQAAAAKSGPGRPGCQIVPSHKTYLYFGYLPWSGTSLRRLQPEKNGAGRLLSRPLINSISIALKASNTCRIQPGVASFRNARFLQFSDRYRLRSDLLKRRPLRSRISCPCGTHPWLRATIRKRLGSF